VVLVLLNNCLISFFAISRLRSSSAIVSFCFEIRSVDCYEARLCYCKAAVALSSSACVWDSSCCRSTSSALSEMSSSFEFGMGGVAGGCG
jgi:hypothetical protein